MKKLLLFTVSAALCIGAHAVETNLNAVVAATLRADGSTNTWTETDLREALGLMNRMYWREMETDSGRRKWHGKRIGQYVFTNGTELVRLDLYDDGFVATNSAAKAGRKFDPEAAAKAAMEAKRRENEARAAWERANLPPELAAIREAQRQAGQTQEVTVIITPEE